MAKVRRDDLAHKDLRSGVIWVSGVPMALMIVAAFVAML